MFGESEKIYRLQKEIDDLRQYCIKFTSDVNNWAQSQAKYNEALEKTIADLSAKLEEKQNG